MKLPHCACKTDWKGTFLCTVHARNLDNAFKEYGNKVIEKAVKIARDHNEKDVATKMHEYNCEVPDAIAETIEKLKEEIAE